MLTRKVPDTLQKAILPGLARQGSYVFISLAKPEVVVLNSGISIDEWIRLFQKLFHMIGFEVHPDTIQRIQLALERQEELKLAQAGV